MVSIIEQISALSPTLAGAMERNAWVLPLLIAQLVMKLIFYPWALYKAAERKQKAWFIVLMIAFIGLNDFGLLPMLYLIFNRQQKQTGKKIKKKL